jgi:hypothetical protein
MKVRILHCEKYHVNCKTWFKSLQKEQVEDGTTSKKIGIYEL